MVKNATLKSLRQAWWLISDPTSIIIHSHSEFSSAFLNLFIKNIKTRIYEIYKLVVAVNSSMNSCHKTVKETTPEWIYM